jgi:hypothetical protein
LQDFSDQISVVSQKGHSGTALLTEQSRASVAHQAACKVILGQASDLSINPETEVVRLESRGFSPSIRSFLTGLLPATYSSFDLACSHQ